MTPLMVVMPQEMLQEPLDRITFIVDGFDKALDLAVRRRRAWPNEPVLDAPTAAGLLKPRLPITVKSKPHGKDQIVVSHHRFDSIRQLGQHLFQKIGSHAAGAIGGDLRDGLPAVVVNGREFILRTRVIEIRQIFQIQMEQFFLAASFRNAGSIGEPPAAAEPECDTPS
jgi:hypothetical protein